MDNSNHKKRECAISIDTPSLENLYESAICGCFIMKVELTNDSAGSVVTNTFLLNNKLTVNDRLDAFGLQFRVGDSS